MSSTVADQRLPVLIIGSGLGGLTLAHSLKKHNIPYEIFERDDDADQRAQGYRVSIDEGGAGGLKSALDRETFELFEKTCAASKPVGGRVDGPSGKVLQKGIPGLLGSGGLWMIPALLYRFLSKRLEKTSWRDIASWVGSWGKSNTLVHQCLLIYIVSTRDPSSGPLVLPSDGGKHYQVDRRMLRSVLLRSQSSHITYNSAFSSYTKTQDSITARFADGSEVRGSLLVGADGIRSKVAAQLAGPSATPFDLGLRIIYGKTPLTPEVEDRLHPTLKKGISFVTDRTAEGQKVTLVFETMRFDHPDAPDNYAFWALTTRRGVFEKDDRLLKMTGSEVASVARRFTASWDPSIRTIFDNQAEDQTAALKVSSSNPDHPPIWPTDRRVTVLGDAVHCMPPTGGQGANAAMYDAALLGEILGASDEEADGGWNENTIDRYEQAMRYNIGDVVGLACVGAQYALGADRLEDLYAGSVDDKKMS
jgi:2-polyprenyl-6-methoxyphenol hydroxylase-like FAD-dependent oxidoreductase